MAQHIRGFGWKRDRHGPLDQPYQMRKPAAVALPPVYRRPAAWSCAIMDQGNTNSCTAHGGVRIMLDARLEQGLPVEPLSRLELYWNTRLIEHTTDEDSGAEIRNVLDTLYVQGVGEERLWPFDESKVNIRPPDVVERAGLQDVALHRQRIDNGNLDLLKDALVTPQDPVIFGCVVWPAIQNLPDNGILPMPGSMNESVGAHCMVIEGYDDNLEAFWVANSWGTSYGLGGYLWIPYKYLTDKDIASDFWHVDLVGIKPVTSKGKPNVRRRK